MQEIKRYTYQNLVDKYGKPIFEYEILSKDYVMTFDEELQDKPYKVAVFSNFKNALGFTVCATYGRSENSEWHINSGDKWVIKQLLKEKALWILQQARQEVEPKSDCFV